MFDCYTASTRHGFEVYVNCSLVEVGNRRFPTASQWLRLFWRDLRCGRITADKALGTDHHVLVSGRAAGTRIGEGDYGENQRLPTRGAQGYSVRPVPRGTIDGRKRRCSFTACCHAPLIIVPLGFWLSPPDTIAFQRRVVWERNALETLLQSKSRNTSLPVALSALYCFCTRAPITAQRH